MLIRSVAMIALLGLSLASGVACGRGTESRTSASGGGVDATAQATAVRTATPAVAVMSEPLYETAQGASVSEMLKTYAIVFVGRVESVAVRQMPIYPPNTDFEGPTVEGKPHTSAPGPTIPISDYSVSVLVSIRGDVSAGDAVTLSVAGGDLELPDGQLRRWVLQGNPLLDVGQTYLLFTTRWESVLVTAPWGKFEIADDRVEPMIDEWATLGVVKELSGKLTAEAIQQIASAE
jgi:hypothetical protein